MRMAFPSELDMVCRRDLSEIVEIPPRRRTRSQDYHSLAQRAARFKAADTAVHGGPVVRTRANAATVGPMASWRIDMTFLSHDLTMPRADLLLRGGRLIDPANNRDGIAAIAIRNGRVLAVGADTQDIRAKRLVDVGGSIVTPGFIDMHVHVYEWVTNFGVPADAAGIQSGATTIVDQGSSGAWTLGGFKAFIADRV